jgi:hypothetical protein
MNRQFIARLLLPLLLMGQPGTAALVHATPVDASAARATSGQAVHCARRDEAAGAHERQNAESPSNASHDAASPADTDCRTDCRKHSSCSCDCVGTSAVAPAPCTAPRVIPDHPAVIGVALPSIERRVVEFLRPPI